MAVAHDGHDVFVGSFGADAERVAKAMGDSLGIVAGLGFGEAVGGVGGVDVEES